MAQRTEPTAAQALYGHLPSGSRESVKQREQSLSASMWPSLTPQAKQRESDQALWDACWKRSRDNFLRAWRADKARGR
jgi:hypothetical protein